MLKQIPDITQSQIRSQAAVDFQLDIPTLGIITCRRILRGIRGKRLLCLGEQGEKQYIVKLFYNHRRAQKHFQQSFTGVQLFVERGIKTPKVYFSGYLKEPDLYCLIFRYLEKSFSIKELLKTPPGETTVQNNILEALMRVIAEQHNRGILQHDLNLGNFLVQNDSVYSIDGDHVLGKSKPISWKPSIVNLASIFQKIEKFTDPQLENLFAVYAKTRHRSPDQKDLFLLRNTIQNKRKMQIFKKVMRKLRIKK